MANTYIAGQFIRFTATFTVEPSGADSDPTEILFLYSVNGGATVQYEYSPGGGLGTIIRDSTGNYHIDVDTTGLAGGWEYEWASKGAPQVISPGGTLQVNAPALVPSF
jgi:hypothetical protein